MEKSALSTRSVVAGLVPLAAVFSLTAFLAAADSGKVFEAPLLLAWLNTIFLCAAPLCLAALAARSFYLSGSVAAQLMGCGLFSFGFASLLAGWVMPMSGHGPNPTVTVHNLGAFLSGAFHLAACAFLSGELKAGVNRGRGKLSVILPYIVLTAAFLALVALVVAGALPVFFTPGTGPSQLRQFVLGSALLFFAVSGAFFLWTHLFSKAVFAFWYGLALVLIAEGLGCVLLQHNVGGPIGWLGRGAQYAASFYFALAFFRGRAGGDAESAGFWPYLERKVKERTAVLEREQKEISEAYKLLASISDGSTDVIYVKDLKGRYLLLNNEGVRVIGRKREDIIGKDDSYIFPETEAKINIAEDREVMASGKVLNYEEVVPTRDGTTTYLSTKGPVYDSDGKVSGLFGVARDITERKQAESALAESERKFRSLVETAQELVWKCDEKGRFTYLNQEWEKTHGYKAEEMLGKGFEEFQPPEVYERDIKEFSRHMAGGSVRGYETIHLAKDGRVINLLFNAVPLFDSQGNIVGTQGTALDITERKRAEQLKEKIALELAEQKQEMENFFYITSHDLRGPLMNIQGYSRSLAADFARLTAAGGAAAGDDIPKALNFIAQSTLKIDQVLNSLLKVSRQGRVVMLPAAQDVNALLKTVMGALRFQLEEAGGELKTGDLPPCTADANALSHIFTNLLANAIKYRDKNRKLEITVSGKVSPGGTVLYSIADNGLGIKEADLPNIWRLFYSGENPGLKKGEGIGLTMVKRMAAANSGSIRAESKEGSGSTFYLELPA